MKSFDKYRAKIEILNYIVRFCTNTFSSCDIGITIKKPKKEYGFLTSFFDMDKIPINTLVKLSAVSQNTKYYLGWLREIKDNGVFLIESIEDGELCNWSNVDINYMPIATINNHPEWQWNDRQFKIKDQWLNACYKSRKCYTLIPIYPEFSTIDNSFYLSLRKNFSDEIVASKRFLDYKKTLVRDMLNFYDDAYSNYR